VKPSYRSAIVGEDCRCAFCGDVVAEGATAYPLAQLFGPAEPMPERYGGITCSAEHIERWRQRESDAASLLGLLRVQVRVIVDVRFPGSTETRSFGAHTPEQFLAGLPLVLKVLRHYVAGLTTEVAAMLKEAAAEHEHLTKPVR